jgi:hypothetical protein
LSVVRETAEGIAPKLVGRDVPDAEGFGARNAEFDDVVFPHLPVTACLSAAHLEAFNPPDNISRIYIARDRDDAGRIASDSLCARMASTEIEIVALLPVLHDFNDDLRLLGLTAMQSALRTQLMADDAEPMIAQLR